MKEYLDKDDNYEEPERIEAAQILDIRLYCQYKDCKKYIKGKEGYNGQFYPEDKRFKHYIDLRNQCWFCKEHKNKVE